MAKKDLMIIVDTSHDQPMTLEELCTACGFTNDFIFNLIEYDIVNPKGSVPEEWIFDLVQLKRIKTAQRLQRDLEVNLAGIALVLDLLDELEELRARAELLDKHFLK